MINCPVQGHAYMGITTWLSSTRSCIHGYYHMTFKCKVIHTWVLPHDFQVQGHAYMGITTWLSSVRSCMWQSGHNHSPPWVSHPLHCPHSPLLPAQQEQQPHLGLEESHTAPLPCWLVWEKWLQWKIKSKVRNLTYTPKLYNPLGRKQDFSGKYSFSCPFQSRDSRRKPRRLKYCVLIWARVHKNGRLE